MLFPPVFVVEQQGAAPPLEGGLQARGSAVALSVSAAED
jgi:hypothetical protein